MMGSHSFYFSGLRPQRLLLGGCTGLLFEQVTDEAGDSCDRARHLHPLPSAARREAPRNLIRWNWGP